MIRGLLVRLDSNMVEITLDVQQAINKCARSIIATESVCIEWGAEAERSVELAAQAITNLVSTLIYTSQFEHTHIPTPPANINSFDVLKRMGDENKQIMICPDVLNMNYSQKTKGTKVEVGVPGNVIGDIFGGTKKAVLLMWDKKEFDELKAKMEAEQQAT